ncbi:MAG: hypothetical protein ACLTMP_10015 [Eggerthella lenta]
MKHFRPRRHAHECAPRARHAVAADGKFGADRHAAKGLTCESPRPRQGQSCYSRHQDLHPVPQHQGSVEKTKASSPRIHGPPHYQDQLDCVNATTHGETENFCDQCHQFGFRP